MVGYLDHVEDECDRHDRVHAVVVCAEEQALLECPRVYELPERGKVLCEARACVKNTGFNYTLSLISGKYKMTILYTIAQFGTVRTNEMQRYIEDISFKTLSANLKELERDGLINRKEYRQVPPKVEYSLTERGETLIPILNAMCAWGYNHRQD